MVQVATSDAARTLMLQRSGNTLKNTVAQHTVELSSGQHTDKARALNGSLAQLTDVENGLVLAKSHAANANLVSTILSAQQDMLERLGKITQDLALDFQLSAQGSDNRVMSEASARASDGFADAIGLLNTKVAGRFVFSGVAGQDRPFAEAGTILDALAASLSSAASVSDMQAQVEAWFSIGGGFDTIAYQGSETANGRIKLGNGISVHPEVPGTEQALRESLAGLALAALGEKFASALSAPQIRSLLGSSATALMGAETSRVALQARIGATQARVDEAKVAANTKAATLQITRNDLLAVDPYEIATALEAASQRLDALYLVTARLSRLSLTEYLR